VGASSEGSRPPEWSGAIAEESPDALPSLEELRGTDQADTARQRAELGFQHRYRHGMDMPDRHGATVGAGA
jgi:hypothetical protein